MTISAFSQNFLHYENQLFSICHKLNLGSFHSTHQLFIVFISQIVSDSEKPLVCIHKVFDLGESGGENETEGMQLASQSEIGYSCEKQQTYRILFDKPVMLMAGHWYVAYASVSSPSGNGSDAGSSGQNKIQGQDK